MAPEYTPFFGSLFKWSDGKNHNEQLLLKELGKWPKEIWINNSPCPNCAHTIGEAVKGEPHGTQVNHVIYFQNFYTIPYKQNPNFAYMLAINCGAYLRYYGVQLMPFDWKKFAQEARLDFVQKKYLEQIFTSYAWGKMMERNKKALQDIQKKYNEIKYKKPDEVDKLCKAQKF